jgi:sirohydrochlorin ferrochelatase
LNPTSLYILVNHGSSQANALRGFDKLIEQVKEQLDTHELFLERATLEFSEFPLSQQIEQIVQRRSQYLLNRVNILPLFLSSGVHINHDIPSEISKAGIKLGKHITLELLPHLGSFPSISNLLGHLFCENSANDSRRILMVHGSKLESANNDSVALAGQLQSSLAFWSIEPSLENIVHQLVANRATSISIIPYFLFDGEITIAVQQKVEKLALYYQNVQFKLTPTLGKARELSSLIAQAIKTNEQNLPK